MKQLGWTALNRCVRLRTDDVRGCRYSSTFLSPTRVAGARFISALAHQSWCPEAVAVNKGASHESWHHSVVCCDPDACRCPAYLAARSQLGLRPSGIVGVVLLIVAVLFLMGRLKSLSPQFASNKTRCHLVSAATIDNNSLRTHGPLSDRRSLTAKEEHADDLADLLRNVPSGMMAKPAAAVKSA